MSKKVTLENRKRVFEMSDHLRVESKKRELQDYQAAFHEGTTPADQHLREVKELVVSLKKMADQFENAGSANRRQFSLQVQHDALQSEIRLSLQNKVESLASKGIDERRNLMICQAFVDDVIVYLAKAGIRLNPLNVIKIPKKREQ